MYSGIAKAQWVAIPDPAFVTHLQQYFPSCMNGNLMDTTCSYVVTRIGIDCSGIGITDLTGIQYFDSLRFLHCEQNDLTYLPQLPPLLEELWCQENQIIYMQNIPAQLQELKCWQNQLFLLPDLPPSLTTLLAGDNQLASLPNLPAGLQTLWISNNNLVALPNLPNALFNFLCAGNNLGSLPTLPAGLSILGAAGCQLTSLPALPPSLTLLHVGQNNLTTLPTLPNSLKELWCYENQLTSLPTLPSGLNILYSRYNQLTSLTNFPDSLNVCEINYNPALTCLPELKKIVNFNFSGTGITCLPNFGNITNSIPSLSLFPLCDPVNAGSCTISYNISGKAYADLNNDCIANLNEIGVEGLKVNLYQSGNLVQQNFTSTNGYFAINTDLGSFDYEIDTSGTPFTVTCPLNGTQSSNLIPADSIDIDMDFALMCKPSWSDIGVMAVVRESGIFRPGHITRMKVLAGDISQYYNLNCVSGTGGTVTVYFSGPVNFNGMVSGSLAPTITGSNFIQFNIPDYGAIDIKTAFRFYMETLNSSLGTPICFLVDVSVLGTDNNPGNNTLTQCFNLVNSYDPNNKESSPLNDMEIGQEWITYTINFQNTGTAPALDIHLIDTLDSNIDESSFTFLYSSHNPYTRLIGNIIEFHFPNINLPDSTNDEPSSHGYVQYKVKLNTGLPVGTTIENNAAIYFDLNAPVVTNTTTNTIVSPTNVSELNTTFFTVYPVPAYDFFVIHTTEKDNLQITFSDLSGRIILKDNFSGNEFKIDVSNIATGMYFVNLENEKFNTTKKIVVK